MLTRKLFPGCRIALVGLFGLFLTSQAALGETTGVSAAVLANANALYRSLTNGVPLIPSNPLYNTIISFVQAKNYLGAAAAITDPATGADEFYNNVVAALPQTMNQNLTAVGDRNELSAMFLVVVRDGLPVDQLLTADFTAFDPTGTPSGVNYAIDDSGCGTTINSPGINCNTGHFIQVWNTTNPKLSLKRTNHPTVPGIGIFTSWPWALNYDTAGTGRRNVRGMMENLYLVSMDAMRADGIPTDSVRQDVPRNDPNLVNNCYQCHTWMDKIVRPFLVKNVTNNTTFVYGFKDKLNDIQGPLYPATGPDFDWFYTPAQAQILGIDETKFSVQTYGATGIKYIHGNDLHDFANIVANSMGFYRGLVKRMVAQILMREQISTSILTDADLAVLDAQSSTIETFTAMLYKSRDLRDMYQRIAVWYSINDN